MHAPFQIIKKVDNIKKLLLDIQLVLRVALKDGLDGSGFDTAMPQPGTINMAVPLGGHDAQGMSSDPVSGAGRLFDLGLSGFGDTGGRRESSSDFTTLRAALGLSQEETEEVEEVHL